ncbi:MAG: hypothetical protein ACJA2Q_002267 [Pseudohongiellaceae bacterium]|jgi:hypothetical protein
MKFICIRNPLSKKDLTLQEEDVPHYFSLYYCSLFVQIVSYHNSDLFGSGAKMYVLLLSILVPLIVTTRFLVSKSKKSELDLERDAVIYTSLPALLVIYSTLISIEILADSYFKYWG